MVAAPISNAQTRVMFDTVSGQYRDPPDVWFDRSTRSPYAYATTEERLLSLLKLSGNETVLEVGCGPGTWTRVIARSAASLHAVDISPEMIARARRFAPGDNVSFEVSDFELFRSETSFDRVVSVRAIEYMSEGPEVAARLASFVAPGGTITIVTKTPFSVWRGRRIAVTLFGRIFKSRAAGSASGAEGQASFHHQRLSHGDLRKVLENAGIVRSRCTPPSPVSPSFAE